jgi:uncharacterized lipoprotein YmbA
MAGCIQHKAPKVSYYSLMDMAQVSDVQPFADLHAIKIGIGPVEIPDSLKRSQIVTRQSGNEYNFSEFNRWVGTLEEDLSLVVGNNVGALLKNESVATFPWMTYFKPDYRIIIYVNRLDGSLDSVAVLEAKWSIVDAEGKELFSSGKSAYEQPLENPTYTSLVFAESQLISNLSQDIAKEIVTLVKN